MKRSILSVLLVGVLAFMGCEKETPLEQITSTTYGIVNQTLHSVVVSYNGCDIHLPSLECGTKNPSDWFIQMNTETGGDSTYIRAHEVTITFDSTYSITHTIKCPSDTMYTEDLKNKIGVTYTPNAHNIFNPGCYDYKIETDAPWTFYCLGNDNKIIIWHEFIYEITDLDYEAAVRAAQGE